MATIQRSPAENLTAREIVLSRAVEAPRELVWRAWTDPLQLARWWGPRGFTTPVCEVDVRPGGRIRIHMRAPDGTVYPMVGVYEEAVPPARLVFASTALDPAGTALFEQHNAVTLVEAGGQTIVTMRARIVKVLTPAAAPYLAGMDEGVAQTLDRLEELLKA